MTMRERVLSALEHKDTRPTPWTIDLTIEETARCQAYFGEKEIERRFDSHIISCAHDGLGWVPEEKPGYVRDKFGVVWNRSGVDKDIGVIDTFVLHEPDMRLLTLPGTYEAEFRRGIENALARAGGRFVMACVGFSLFERAWTLRGMENLLSDMVLHPGFVHDLMDAICEYNLRVIDIALSCPVDGIYFGDDWGQQSGLIMGPRHWRTFIKPRLARMYARVRDGGKYCAQHSCGDIGSVFPDLIDIGLNCYQTFQPEIYDVEAVKREFGEDLTFWGGISTQRLLPFATPERVKQETLRLIRVLGKGGGYIVAPTHSVPYDVPPQNVEALLSVFHNQDSLV